MSITKQVFLKLTKFESQYKINSKNIQKLQQITAATNNTEIEFENSQINEHMFWSLLIALLTSN